jgi:Flp pilus assembly protein TadD
MNRQQRRAAAKGGGSEPPFSGGAPAAAQAFAQGAMLHQAGRLAEAEQALRQAAALDPRHVDALHLLGMIRLQLGDGRSA